MKNRKNIVGFVLAFTMVFTVMMGSMMPAFAVGTTDNIVGVNTPSDLPTVNTPSDLPSTNTPGDLPIVQPTVAPTPAPDSGVPVVPGGEAEPEPEVHTHNWNLTRQSDSSSHYYVCYGCGARDEVAAHTFNAAGNCTVCGYHSDAAVVAPQPTATPAPTVEPSATPAPEATPDAETAITEEKASEDVIQAAKDAVVVEESKATVDKAAVEAIVDATQEGETVVLPLAQVTEEAVTEAVVNTEALKNIADSETDVVVQFSEVTVKLDAEALKAVTAQANGENIELKVVTAEKETLTADQQAALENKETAIVVTAQIFSDGQYIGDFKGGKATVMLPFTPEEGKAAEDYKVYFIGEDGTLEEVMAEYVDGHMVFTTAHFSDYVIVYETALTDTPVQPQEPVTEEKASMPIIPIIIGIVVVAAAAVLLKKKKA